MTARAPRYSPRDPFPNTQRIPPQALEAEQAVLGCLMLPLDGQPQRVKAVRERLTAGDFYSDAHRRILEAALLAADRGDAPDVLTVASELEKLGALDHCGGRAYLLACQEKVPAASRLPQYMAAVRRTSGQRRAIERLGEITGLAYDGIPPEELADQMRSLASEPRLSGCRSGPRLETITASDLRNIQFAPIRWAVPSLIPEGLTLLYGPSKGGKSFLLAGICAGVAEGGMALGAVPVDGGEVLYIALEDPERRLQSRHRSVAPDDSWPPRLHFATRCPSLNEGAIPAIAEWIEAQQSPRLVVVDTFGRIRGDFDERAGVYWTEYRTMARLQELALRYGIALVVAHHANKLKDTADEYDTASGSTGMLAAADAIIKLKGKRGDQTATLVITGREIPDAKLAIQRDHTGAWTLLGEAEAHFRSIEELDALLALSTTDAPMEPKELAEALQIAGDAARQRLKRMEDRGFVRRTAKGYTLTDQGTRTLRVTGVTGVTPDSGVTTVTDSCSSRDRRDSCDSSDSRDSRDSGLCISEGAPPGEWGGAS